MEAKLANQPLPQQKPAKPQGKVVDLMSALRQSLAGKEPAKTTQKAAKGKLKLVPGKRSKTA